VHTAHPNVSGPASSIHRNVFANFSSFAIGGYSLYFDYGSSGCNASQNLAYNTGSGMFFNSNSEIGGWPGSWQALTDNAFVFDHNGAGDLNTLIHWRTLAPLTNATRNLFYVAHGVNATGDFKLFLDHTSTQKHQWDGVNWNRNLYFLADDPNSTFGITWPFAGTLVGRTSIVVHLEACAEFDALGILFLSSMVLFVGCWLLLFCKRVLNWMCLV
jgi:hypothetical protein